MRVAAEDPTLSVLAINTAVTTLVGLLVGLVSFPGRWLLQWRSRRRQDDVAAYRQAHRLLREVQLEARYPAPIEAGDHREERIAEAVALRWNNARRAWDEALHLVSFTRDKKTYELLAELDDLFRRAPVVEAIHQGIEEDPGPSLLAAAIEVLAWRERRALRPLPQPPDLEYVRGLISGAEAEADEREREQAEEYRRWRAERAAAMRAAQVPVVPESTTRDAQSADDL